MPKLLEVLPRFHARPVLPATGGYALSRGTGSTDQVDPMRSPNHRPVGPFLDSKLPGNPDHSLFGAPRSGSGPRRCPLFGPGTPPILQSCWVRSSHNAGSGDVLRWSCGASGTFCKKTIFVVSSSPAVLRRGVGGARSRRPEEGHRLVHGPLIHGVMGWA